MALVLTEDQNTALNEIKVFLDNDAVTHTLVGHAGSGKTTLTKEVVKYVINKSMCVIGVAPTHKARKVLDMILNDSICSFVNVDTMTVSKLLSKTRSHGYLGTKNFASEGINSSHFRFDLIIADECSMIQDRDVSQMIAMAKKTETKILFVGDSAQIPNPAQSYITNTDDTISKKDSSSFDQPQSKLITIMRQTDNNPILQYAVKLRDTNNKEIEQHETSVIDGHGIAFTRDPAVFLEDIKNTFTNHKLEELKIICYTNNRVSKYNKYVRKTLGRTDLIETGDILMGYNNVGFPMRKIENGQDYKVVSVKHSVSHGILEFPTLDGYKTAIQEITRSKLGAKYNIFIPNVSSEQNVGFMSRLATLAEKINRIGSTKDDFKRYIRYKDKAVFMENIYKINGVFRSESQMKEMYPVLFQSTDTFIVVLNGKMKIREKISQELKDKVTDIDANILTNRIKDNKSLSDKERLVDKYQIIEKDMDYGYAITSHKSQGSTYHTVFVDERDFDRMKKRWNYRYKKYENVNKEKSQLKYVAYTRPTTRAVGLVD